MDLNNIPKVNPFYVDGIKVEMTAIMGTFIFHPSETKRQVILNYLEKEGFLSKNEQSVEI